jgi:Domain of unknown function (DUF4173)
VTDIALQPPAAADPPGRLVLTAPAARRLAALAVLAGLLLEIGLRGGLANAAVAAGLVVAVLALAADGRIRRREAQLLALAALVPIVFLAVRSSPWLILSNIVAAGGLLTAAVLFSRSGSVFDTSPTRALVRSVESLARGLGGVPALRAVAPPLVPGDWTGAVRVAAAAVVTLPVLVLLVALLASADAVFASLLVPDVDLGPAAGHVVLTLMLAAPVLVAGLAAASASGDTPPLRGAFGMAEVTTMLGLAAGVLVLFVVAQVVALTDAGERLVEEAGLTPAEYARGGFFQLCWAAGLILAFLWVVRALAAPVALEHPVVRGLGAAVPLLTLGLVGVSLRRMALYDDAFGLTMLRLWVVGAAVWMGAVLVMAAVRNAARRPGRSWLLGGAGVAAAVLVVVADLANPEAFVARHNLDRARDGAELDVEYLRHLSDDAVPTLADGLPSAVPCTPDPVGAAALNLAVASASEVRGDVCDERIPLPGG